MNIEYYFETVKFLSWYDMHFRLLCDSVKWDSADRIFVTRDSAQWNVAIWNSDCADINESKLCYLTLPYLTCGADACARQAPSAEATARAQCASPTDLKVDRNSLKLWQTSGGEAIGCHSAYPMKE